MEQSIADELEEIRRLIAHERAFAIRSPQLAGLAWAAIERYEIRADRLAQVRKYA